jgi:hypothetical protein
MWKSLNVHGLKIGDRVRLTKFLVNENSSFISQENLPVGLEGTVTHVNEGNYALHIHMKWDNGSTLALLETDNDYYEKCSSERKKPIEKTSSKDEIISALKRLCS